MERLEKSKADSKWIDLVQTIQNQVIDIVKEKYPNCYENDLDFWVSRLFGKDEKDEKIILTIKHMGHCFSRYIFPQEDNFYGLDSLYDIIVSLYNQSV